MSSCQSANEHEKHSIVTLSVNGNESCLPNGFLYVDVCMPAEVKSMRCHVWVDAASSLQVDGKRCFPILFSFCFVTLMLWVCEEDRQMFCLVTLADFVLSARMECGSLTFLLCCIYPPILGCRISKFVFFLPRTKSTSLSCGGHTYGPRPGSNRTPRFWVQNTPSLRAGMFWNNRILLVIRSCRVALLQIHNETGIRPTCWIGIHQFSHVKYCTPVKAGGTEGCFHSAWCLYRLAEMWRSCLGLPHLKMFRNIRHKHT